VTATPPPGGIPRPDCIPASATFANVPSGTDLVTPVALLGTPGDRGVVLGSQSNGGICQMVPFASEVAERGYRVAVIEWRGDRTDSMAAAVRTMTADGATRVVVGGFSEGAVIGLGGAASFGPTVVGVVAVSGGPSREDGYPSIASVSGFPGPLLLVRARDDAVFPGTPRRGSRLRTRGRRRCSSSTATSTPWRSSEASTGQRSAGRSTTSSRRCSRPGGRARVRVAAGAGREEGAPGIRPLPTLRSR
jgi:pimeloyl-ACP methyl ester carboxylesterase